MLQIVIIFGHMNLELRLADTSDYEYIIDVYNSIIPGKEVTADLEPVTVADWMPWFEKHQEKNRPIWILMADGQACGWMSFSDYYGRPAYYITAQVSIYLHEDFRGKGLGKRFLVMGMDYIKQYEVRKVIGVIYAANRPSIKIFKSLGFEQWGLLPGVCLVNETEKDVVILGKEL